MVLRICVVSSGDIGRDAETQALVRSLVGVGHEVVTVDGGRGVVSWPGAAVRVPARVPTWNGLIGRVLRRIQPPSYRVRTYRRRLAAAVAAAAADIVYPAAPRDLAVAVAGAGIESSVMVAPGTARVETNDIAVRAPADPRLSSSPAGQGIGHHMPGWVSPGAIEGGRHEGKCVVAVYRETESTPGRYLTAAMRRAGIDVITLGTTLDWSNVPEHAAAVVIVESPLPAAEVVGEPNGVPVLFWVHHGEHHLATNLRLVDRYGADAVLLAHSWHLAHRFGVPVHRFPFGVPVELMGGEQTTFEERPVTVSMVGAGLDALGGRYGKRADLAGALMLRFGDAAQFRQGVSPDELMNLYGQSKVVINDGGDRHRPITMRVFEATGAGALLVTDDLPGTEVLFERGTEYEVAGASLVDQVATLARTGGDIARAGYTRAMSCHTYDHRVNGLLAIAAASSPRPSVQKHRWSLILDPDVTTVISIGVTGIEPALVDRWVPVGRTADAVVIGHGVGVGLEEVVARARRFVYCVDPELWARLRALLPDAIFSEVDGVLKVEVEPGAGYRVAPS